MTHIIPHIYPCQARQWPVYKKKREGDITQYASFPEREIIRQRQPAGAPDSAWVACVGWREKVGERKKVKGDDVGKFDGQGLLINLVCSAPNIYSFSFFVSSWLNVYRSFPLVLSSNSYAFFYGWHLPPSSIKSNLNIDFFNMILIYAFIIIKCINCWPFWYIIIDYEYHLFFIML
jgi:hypothetical protein